MNGLVLVPAACGSELMWFGTRIGFVSTATNQILMVNLQSSIALQSDLLRAIADLLDNKGVVA